MDTYEFKVEKEEDIDVDRVIEELPEGQDFAVLISKDYALLIVSNKFLEETKYSELNLALEKINKDWGLPERRDGRFYLVLNGTYYSNYRTKEVLKTCIEEVIQEYVTAKKWVAEKKKNNRNKIRVKVLYP